ncbi:MAG: hypothetical protein ACI9T8_000465 [Candidatus Saccharimonadales bacterium]|jgi:hypothetical protein
MYDKDGRIFDKEVALNIAYAQKPYIDIAETSDAVGKHWLAQNIAKIGIRAAQQTEQLANHENRMRNRIMEKLAFLNLCEIHGGRIHTLTDFKLSDPKHGQGSWNAVYEVAEKEDNFPVQFTEYFDGHFALTGDFWEAVPLLHDSNDRHVLSMATLHLEASLEAELDNGTFGLLANSPIVI